MDAYAAVLFFTGLIGVIAGAELVIRGGVRLAALLRLSPMMIGLTVVSIGTSTPELAVGITAALEGRGELAVGNIAGTNLFNLLFILGLSALVRPLPLRLISIKLDLPVMIGVALALLAMAWDGLLSRLDGLILVAASILYTTVLVWLSRRESASIKEEFSQEYGGQGIFAKPMSRAVATGVLVVGIIICVWGADLLVSGAVRMAQLLGVSDALIGLTIVAIGTSAPELATTAISTIRNERDIAVGNLIGSSIYNVLVILGLTCLASPGGVNVSEEILLFDLPLGAAVTIVCFPIFRSGNVVSRIEGALFVTAYLVYLYWLVLVRI